jgi:TPR repeat protein
MQGACTRPYACHSLSANGKAAERGYVAAQTDLGVLLSKGQGVAKNDVEAVKWYQKAANAGDHRAQLYLGYQYRSGRGVLKDRNMAQHWLSRARNSPDNSISSAALQGLNAKESQLSDVEVILGLVIGAAILGAAFDDGDSSDPSSSSYEYKPAEIWQPAPQDYLIN